MPATWFFWKQGCITHRGNNGQGILHYLVFIKHLSQRPSDSGRKWSISEVLIHTLPGVTNFIVFSCGEKNSVSLITKLNGKGSQITGFCSLVPVGSLSRTHRDGRPYKQHSSHHTVSVRYAPSHSQSSLTHQSANVTLYHGSLQGDNYKDTPQRHYVEGKMAGWSKGQWKPAVSSSSFNVCTVTFSLGSNVDR